ncbi:hypothetical protein GQ44DRAFT_736272 [Phaeosphaeriaceae sp. PMI808]|nr:hypothetical protein GQ44DRAFT_736272 [Phaeosphaeriaceae sp. PMI808]
MPQRNASGSVLGFEVNEPARFKKVFRGMPAIDKWFESPAGVGTMPARLNVDYLRQFGETMVPLELTHIAPMQKHSDMLASPDRKTKFERFDAPFSTLLYKSESPNKDAAASSRLYLAQAPLADFPATMQADVPIPSLISRLGSGDIYGSSLWMGRAPTCTPLHRDPNPNLLVQLSGKKLVRLLRPDIGRAVYEKVQAKLGRSGSANMRGEEMMQGEEMEALENAVWNDEEFRPGQESGFEINLKRGDGLYIPLGWWHAVRGTGIGANASVSHCICIKTKY